MFWVVVWVIWGLDYGICDVVWVDRGEDDGVDVFDGVVGVVDVSVVIVKFWFGFDFFDVVKCFYGIYEVGDCD